MLGLTKTGIMYYALVVIGILGLNLGVLFYALSLVEPPKILALVPIPTMILGAWLIWQINGKFIKSGAGYSLAPIFI